MQCQGSLETGRAKDHGLFERQALGQWDNPVGFHTRILAKAAIMGNAEVVAADNLPVGDAGQSIFVVYAGVGDANEDFAGGEIGQRQFLDAGGEFIFRFIDHKGAKCCGHIYRSFLPRFILDHSCTSVFSVGSPFCCNNAMVMFETPGGPTNATWPATFLAFALNALGRVLSTGVRRMPLMTRRT